MGAGWRHNTRVRKHRLGGSGLEVGHIGLGCVTFGREIDESESLRILDYAFERGINLLDTSEAYGGRDRHSSEKIIGNWLHSRAVRHHVVLQSKVKRTFHRAQIREALAGSLDRLRTDCLDVYLFHVYDPSAAVEECVETMNEAIEAGQIRAWGCSNWDVTAIADSVLAAENRGLRRLETVEPIYNLVHRNIESDLLPFCRRRGIGVTSYSPLGAGFLAGKYGPDRAMIPAGTRFDVKPGHIDKYFGEAGFGVLQRLRDLSARSGIPMVKLAMAWVAHRPDVTSVLVGARSTEHIDNALAAEQEPSLHELVEDSMSWNNALLGNQ